MKANIPNLWNIARAIFVFQKGTFLLWLSSCVAVVPQIAAGHVAYSLGVNPTHREGRAKKIQRTGAKGLMFPPWNLHYPWACPTSELCII